MSPNLDEIRKFILPSLTFSQSSENEVTCKITFCHTIELLLRHAFVPNFSLYLLSLFLSAVKKFVIRIRSYNRKVEIRNDNLDLNWFGKFSYIYIMFQNYLNVQVLIDLIFYVMKDVITLMLNLFKPAKFVVSTVDELKFSSCM